MAFARVMLSRRSCRMALRCWRWSLSRRDTFDACRSCICTPIGNEAEMDGRRMAWRRREVGVGPKVEERVDMLMSKGAATIGAQHLRQVYGTSLSLKTALDPHVCVSHRRRSRYPIDLSANCFETQSRTDHTVFGNALQLFESHPPQRGRLPLPNFFRNAIHIQVTLLERG